MVKAAGWSCWNGAGPIRSCQAVRKSGAFCAVISIEGVVPWRLLPVLLCSIVSIIGRLLGRFVSYVPVGL